MIIGFIVWTRKFVGFGDKTDDVSTKQKHEKQTIILSLYKDSTKFFKIMSVIYSILKSNVY